MFDWHQSIEGFVTDSRRAQQLPDRITNPIVLARVAVLLRSQQRQQHTEGGRPQADGRATASV